MSTTEAITEHVRRVWDDEIVPALDRYIRIPNVSPAFDEQWADHGFMGKALDLLVEWCRDRPIAGLTVEVQELEGLTPLIICEVDATDDDLADRTVVLYGHFDKQPEMTGWRTDGGPWTPILEGDRLYGRGGADDGYAVFAALTAIEAAQANGVAHGRCVVLIEASEESGSTDLPAHLEALGDRLGEPELVICLDSGAIDTERMWVTTSLRGLVGGNLHVEVLDEGVHSGAVSGVVPSSFRIIRQLLDRIEDSATGEVLLAELHVDVPADRRAEAATTAAEIDDPFAGEFVLAGDTRRMGDDITDQLIARTWRPTLSYVGAAGLPPADRAGNVLRPSTTLALSFRLPPTCDSDAALDAITAALTSDPPSGASVSFVDIHRADGWNAPATAPWLANALDEASTATFGRPGRTLGEGGSIPFMAMLGERYPTAQFLVTGVLVPGSNAHGPNEFLHLPTARNITAAVTHVLGAHAAAAR